MLATHHPRTATMVSACFRHRFVMQRAIQTLWLVLEGTDLMWIPVKRSWRLNERHYGALTVGAACVLYCKPSGSVSLTCATKRRIHCMLPVLTLSQRVLQCLSCNSACAATTLAWSTYLRTYHWLTMHSTCTVAQYLKLNTSVEHFRYFREM